MKHAPARVLALLTLAGLLPCGLAPAATPPTTSTAITTGTLAKPNAAPPALPSDLAVANYTLDGQVCTLLYSDLAYERLAFHRPPDRLKTAEERQQYLDSLLDNALLKDSLWRLSDEGRRLSAEEQAVLAEKERAILAAQLRQVIMGLAPEPGPVEVSQYYAQHPDEFRGTDGTVQPLAAVGARLRQKLLADARQQYYAFFFEDYLRRTRPLVKEELVSMAAPDPKAPLVRLGDTTWMYGDLLARLAGDAPRLERFGDPARRGAVLEEMIRQEVAVLAARRLGLNERPAFRAAYGCAAKDYLFERKVNGLYLAIAVTKDELRVCYDQHRDLFQAEPETRIQVMNIAAAGGETATPATRAEALTQARAAFEAARASTDFAEVARRYSPKDWKVDFDFQPQGPRGHVIDLAVEPLKPGEISAPVEHPGGYYIIKLIEARPARPLAYDEAHEQVEKYLKSQRLIEQKKALLAAQRTRLQPRWNDAALARLRAAWSLE